MNRQSQDSYCVEIFLAIVVTVTMITMWEPNCSNIFNTYVFLSCNMIIVIRRIQIKWITHIETNYRNQLILVGFIMPVFIGHTVIGIVSFFRADLIQCRMAHQGEILYMLDMLFAISMCIVFFLILTCILIPSWINSCKKIKNPQSSDAVSSDQVDQAPLLGQQRNQSSQSNLTQVRNLDRSINLQEEYVLRDLNGRLRLENTARNINQGIVRNSPHIEPPSYQQLLNYRLEEQHRQLEQLLNMMMAEQDIEALISRGEIHRGMSLDQIARLNSIKISKKIQKKLKNENCTICLENYKEGDQIRELGGCGHFFHQKCIDQWLVIKEMCPNCKKNQLLLQEGDNSHSQLNRLMAAQDSSRIEISQRSVDYQNDGPQIIDKNQQ